MTETLFTVTREIRHCKTCPHTHCMHVGAAGCESIMAPIPPTKVSGKTYVAECVKRTWFDKNHMPVEIWDGTKIKPDMTPEEFESLMAEELRKAREEVKKHG